MLLSILIFSVAVFFVSFLISKRYSVFDRTEIATYMVIIAWGSLLFGLFIPKLVGGAYCLTAVR